MRSAKGIGVMFCLAASSCNYGGTPPHDPSGDDQPPASQPARYVLVRAIEAGDTPTALAMIHAGQGLDDGSESRRTPVTTAIESGNVEVLNALIAAGALVDPVGRAGDYVGMAAASGQWPMFEFVRSVCPTLTARAAGDRTALQCLAFGNRTQKQPDADRIAVALIDAGVDPHFCGNGVRAYPKFAALPMAAMHPYRASLVKTLLSHVDWSPAELDLALSAAAKTGAVDAVVNLQRARADKQMQPPSPQVLCDAAARYDTAAAVEALMAGGADVNGRQKKLDRTALHRAVASGDASNVRVLLEHNADLAALDAEGLSCNDLVATRLKRGREVLSDSPVPGYEPENRGHPEAGSAVATLLNDWQAQHQDVASRIEAAKHARPQIVARPAADPAAALTACNDARRGSDAERFMSLLLLPDEPGRRLAVVRRLDITTVLDSELPSPRLERIERFDSVAVAHVMAIGALYSSKKTLYYEAPTVQILSRRGGGWLVVADPTEGGGLTPLELKAIEPAMRAQRDRPPVEPTFYEGSK